MAFPLPPTVPANDYDELYNCSWFPKMTLLIYLLFLNVAGVVLYVFPYRQSTAYLTVAINIEATVFLSWLAVDIGVVWLFAVAALHWPIWKYYRSRHRHRPDQTLIGLMLPHHNIAYFTTSKRAKKSRKGWFPVFLCLLPSFGFSFFAIYSSDWNSFP